MSGRDEKLFRSSYQALRQYNVPAHLAKAASEVVATDAVPIARTAEQQTVIEQALEYVNLNTLKREA